MAQPEKIIAYRIVQVAVEDFKMLPQQLNEKEKLGINTILTSNASDASARLFLRKVLTN